MRGCGGRISLPASTPAAHLIACVRSRCSRPTLHRVHLVYAHVGSLLFVCACVGVSMLELFPVAAHSIAPFHGYMCMPACVCDAVSGVRGRVQSCHVRVPLRVWLCFRVRLRLRACVHLRVRARGRLRMRGFPQDYDENASHFFALAIIGPYAVGAGLYLAVKTYGHFTRKQKYPAVGQAWPPRLRCIAGWCATAQEWRCL